MWAGAAGCLCILLGAEEVPVHEFSTTEGGGRMSGRIHAWVWDWRDMALRNMRLFCAPLQTAGTAISFAGWS